MLINKLDSKNSYIKKQDLDNILNISNNEFNKYNYLYHKEPIINKNPDDLEHKNIYNVIIDYPVNNIEDLLYITDNYKIYKNINYNIDIKILNKIKPDLIKLNSMIGLYELKNNIVFQILYYIQNLHNFDEENSDYMHTVLYGPPGTGKTDIAKILGNIFCKMNILPNNTFKKVTRADLIAGYLGQTALKTKKIIEESLGGVLFIDEAYALGNSEKRDSFAKECIDTLCEALSNYKSNLMVIIAGYEEELNNCFFKFNEGLESRFIWKFNIKEYNYTELYKIFINKVKKSGWFIESNSNIDEFWFKDNIDYFEFYGRSVEILFTKCKIAHSKRIFTCNNNKKHLNLEDLENGLKMMKVKNVNDNYKFMYT